MSMSEVPDLVQQLYATADRLEALFPGRKLTPDGHLVGSIGEVLAAHIYGLSLLPGSTEGHDARAGTGLLVQVKATQRDRISLYSQPQHLIVLRLLRDGSCEEIYNGPGAEPWIRAGAVQKNGQRCISTSALGRLMKSVPAELQLERVG